MPLSVRLVVLSLAAGCVDAIAFVRADVFPANMTGNSVILALALARVNVGALTLPAAALAAFCAGAALGAAGMRGDATGWTRRTNLAVGAVAALLLLAAGLAWLGAGVLPAVALSALAMGLQSALVQRFGVPGVATVVVTGTLTTAIARLVDRPGVSRQTAEMRRLPAATWLAYVVGAVLGGLQSLPHLGALLFLPGALIAALAAATSAFSMERSPTREKGKGRK